MRLVHALLLMPALLDPAPAHACLWDSDTLEEEALAQKDVGEIVRGRLRKRSTFFYEQKVAYTLPMVSAGTAKPERYDDLAVAYDKLGKLDDAIAIMDAKETKYPGLYTTKANLGTFYAHRGDYDRALPLLESAIAQNPNAHFGREHYQVKAIRYLQALAKDPSVATRTDLLGIDIREPDLLAHEPARKKPGRKTGLEEAGLTRDVFVALAGIIRFGGGDKSPHIWFSLGAALALEGDRHLALRAFFRADELGHPHAAAAATAVAEVLRDFGAPNESDASERPVYDRERLRAEARASAALDDARQAKEDAQLRAGKFRQVFGY